MRKGGRAKTRVGESTAAAATAAAAQVAGTYNPLADHQPTPPTIPLQNPDGLYWRPMPSAFVPAIRERAKSSRMFRRLWFWALVTTASLAFLLLSS